MNWAAEHEVAPAQKSPHYAVEYENPSRKPEYHCGNCKNFIKASPNRCRTVIAPIAEAAWCVRYKEKA